LRSCSRHASTSFVSPRINCSSSCLADLVPRFPFFGALPAASAAS
jgi:hypothetical protein